MKKNTQNPLPPSHGLVFRGGELIVPSGTELSGIPEGTPEDKVRAAFKAAEIEYLRVPLLDKSAFIPCFSLARDASLPEGWQSIPLRTLISGGVPGPVAGASYCGMEASAISPIFRACHIMQWLSVSKFCGSCGGKNGFHQSELARVCPVCGRIEYPRLSPAIIVRIINKNDEILLAHDRKFTENIYSLVAGFCEAGEGLENTVEREVFEEVGIRVKNIRYIASQSWPFPSSLMIGFAADHADGGIRCDGVEIEDARWFSRDKLPQLPGHGSISRFIIEQWRAKRA
jgi:NAD+ diphosphatase